MNINGINIEEHGSGYSVTVRAFVGRSHKLGEGDIARILAVMKALGGSGHEAEVPEREDDQARPAAEAPTPRTRGRRARKDAEPSGTSGRRSRGRAALDTEAGKGDDGDGGDSARPVSRSRRGAQKVPVADPAPKSRRGSRAKAADEAITDMDLTKAASEAATLITPKGVKEVIAKFKVKSVGDIPQGRRQEFLVALDKYIPF